MAKKKTASDPEQFVDIQSRNTRELTFTEWTYLLKMAEKKVKELKETTKVPVGSHTLSFELDVDGLLVKDQSGETSPAFYPTTYLKPILLLYAKGLGAKAESWLHSLLGLEGAMGAVLGMSEEAVKKQIPSSLEKTWDNLIAEAKVRFKNVNTSVSGTIQVIDNPTTSHL
jgi:hypothetical protein